MKKLELNNLLFFARVMMVLAIFSIPAWRFLLPEDANDPIWLRLVISGYLLALYIFSFLSKAFRERPLPYLYFSTFLLTIWIASLNYLNGFVPEYVLSYFILLYSCSLFYQDRRWLLAYVSTNLVTAFACFFFTVDPVFDRNIFIIMAVFMLSTIYLALGMRIRIRKKLAREEAQYREITKAAFESAKDGILVVDRDRKIIEVNKSFQQFWGRTDLVGTDGKLEGRSEAKKKLLNPSNFNEISDRAHEFPEENTHDIVEFRDGRVYERYSQPLETESGFKGRLWYLTDITQKISHEKKLKEQLSLIQTTLESSEMGIIVLDNEGFVKTFNDKYLEIWGLKADYLYSHTPEEIIAKCWEKVEDAVREKAEVKIMKESGNLVDPMPIRFLDGRIVERYTRKLIIDNEDSGRVWFYHDITAREKAREELLQRNFELDSFVYRASHDLKAPLNSIMGLIGIMQKENQEAEVNQYLLMMNKSVMKLDTFIRNLTDFSRNARLELVKEEIFLNNTITEIIESLRYMDNADCVKFEIEIEENVSMWSDPVRLGIVLTNLISNSIKYLDREKPKCKVNIRAKVQASQVFIEVEDNGIGIPKSHQEKIFDLFFRASVQSYGSGIGLYITKNAVERMEGEMEFHSVLGEGSRFTLRFPNFIPQSELA